MRPTKTGPLMVLLILPLMVCAATGPKISFDKESHDYGDVQYGDTVTEEFGLTNTGDKTLVIEKLRATCGCTKAVKGSREVPPGGKSSIAAEFDTNGLSPGTKKQTIMVHSNDPERPIVKLTLLARVVRHVTVTPAVLAKKLPTFTNTLTFPLKISNSSEKPVTIERIESKGSGVTAALKPKKIVVEPGGKVPFHVVMTLDKEPGRYLYPGRLLIHADHDREKQISINYFVQVGNRK